MGTNATATLRTTMWFCAALATVVLTAMPPVAAEDSVDCSPAVCTSPVPGNHLDVETR